MRAPLLLMLALLTPQLALAEEGDGTAGESRPAQGNRTAGSDGSNNTTGSDGSNSSGPGPSGEAARTYRVGPLTLRLDRDRIEDIRVDDTDLLERIEVPGLSPIQSEERTERRLALRGHTAGLLVELGEDSVTVAIRSVNNTLRGTIADDVESHAVDGRVRLAAGRVAASLSSGAEGVRLDDDRIAARDLLVLHAGIAQPRAAAQWSPPEPQRPGATLPYVFEGRFLRFTLTANGVEGLAVHGTPIGGIEGVVRAVRVPHRDGETFTVQADGLNLIGRDTPRTFFQIEGRGLTADLAPQVTLPSGARVVSEFDGRVVRVRVAPPADAIVTDEDERVPSAARSGAPAETTLAAAPAEAGAPVRLERSRDGVRTQLGAPRPGLLEARFEGRWNGTDDSVTVQLGLVRAILVQDVDGDGLVGVGEPALAETRLTNGVAARDGDTIRTTFQLWSGTFTVVTSLTDDGVKITYQAHGLQAPPGSLFVLESVTDAPAGSVVEPTEYGLSVRGAAARAVYTVRGPVFVDGQPAWAHHSILLPGDGTIHILLTYPAGDVVYHDPTITVQGLGAAPLPQLIRAHPLAFLVGLAAAAVIVVATIAARRR